MTKKNKVLVTVSASLLSFVAIGTLISTIPSGIAHADSKEYLIECNSTKNILSTSTDPSSGSGEVFTKLGNGVTFDYNSLSHPENGWQTINSGGYFLNTSKIKGVSSLDIYFVNDNASITLEYGWNSLESLSKVDLNAENKHILYSFDLVEGNYPSLIKVSAGETSQTIASMNINFECATSEVMTKTEFDQLFESEINEDDEITITEYIGELTDVIIPSLVFGEKMYTVTVVGEGSFVGNKSLTSVVIPNTITTIEKWSFAVCQSLASICIPKSVTFIGDNSFYDCGLSAISVDSENTVYDSRDNCNAIIEKSSNTLLFGSSSSFIPDGITAIKDYAFIGCDLKSITIPDSVTSIGVAAFNGCELTSINISKSVTSIGGQAFTGCPLTSVTIDSENTVYDSRDNCNAIIETETNQLVFACVNTVIPNTVTSIGACAYTTIDNLVSVVIPSSVIKISSQAFYCFDLVSIYIPTSVTTIEYMAFSGSNDLVISTGFTEKPGGWNTSGWTYKEIKWGVEPPTK